MTILPIETNPSAMGATDPDAALAALMVETSVEERIVHEQMRDQEDALADAAENEEVQTMRRKADDGLREGLESGALTMVAGGFETAGGVFAATGHEALGRVSCGLGTMTQGVEKLWTSQAEAQQRDDDANIAQAEHTAAHGRRASEQETNAVNDTTKTEGDALEFYRDYSRTRDEAMIAAIHRA